ncbi:hypothetical protein H4R18_000860 [Coemansia javaensis]|uniref:Small EDRK-rich factor-like N-terminal domain-containing protein n=1 Tax=Coemansia javaensis TaxID=2761396 RepID=A0A9W8LM55_9FUNG|nr:hypothetical protein H4R18_000860 [Coemansia javaensis]
MGNGAKAQQKRERAKKAAGGVAKSQLKANEAAKTIMCQRCKQTFMCTARRDTLQDHSTKCKAEFDACFPGYVDPPSKKK